MPTALKRFLRITPQQLRAFEATARLLSITQAAQELNVTQPTISTQLRELAEKVGQQLFTNEGNKLKLTSAGEALVQTEAEVGRSWQRYEQRLLELKGTKEQALPLCAEAGAEYFLPQLLRNFENDHPAANLVFFLGSRESALQKFKAGRYDFALVVDDASSAELEKRAIYCAQLVVIAAVNHPLARSAEPLLIDQLRGERWLQMGESPPKDELPVGDSMIFENYDAIHQCVAAGMGVALVPADTQVDRPGVIQLNVVGFPKPQPWVLVWARDKPLSSAAQSFVNHISKFERSA